MYTKVELRRAEVAAEMAAEEAARPYFQIHTMVIQRR